MIFSLFIFTLVWAVSFGISCYAKEYTRLGGPFDRTNEVITVFYFVCGPLFAITAMTLATLRFLASLPTQNIYKPFRFLTSEGRHQIKMEKKRRERELEQEERKRLEAQNDTISALLIETELEKDSNPEDHEKVLTTEINKTFDETVRKEVDDVVGPLIDAKMSEAFRKAGLGESLDRLKELDKNLSEWSKHGMQESLNTIKEINRHLKEEREVGVGVKEMRFDNSSKMYREEASLKEEHKDWAPLYENLIKRDK